MTNSTIQDYMRGKDVPTLRDLQCFVGMLQTSEATLKDFEDAGVKPEVMPGILKGNAIRLLGLDQAWSSVTARGRASWG